MRVNGFFSVANNGIKSWNLNHENLAMDSPDAEIERPFPVSHIAIDAQNTRLAVEEAERQLIVYDISEEDQPDKPVQLVATSRFHAYDPIFSPDGRYLFVGTYSDLKCEIVRFDLHASDVQGSMISVGYSSN